MEHDTKVADARRRWTATVALAGVSLGLALAPAASARHHPTLASWRIEEGSGQMVRDFSGHRNHGVLGATRAADAADPDRIALRPSRSNGRQALRFDGDDYVVVPDSRTLEPEHVSVAATVRADSSPGSNRYIASKGALQCESASYGLYTGVDGGLRFYVSDGFAYAVSPDAGGSLWDGRWHDVLGTFDGRSVRLFVDGEQIGAGTPTSISVTYGLPTHDDFYIGDYRGSCASPFGFVGDIDAVAVGVDARPVDWSGV